MAKLLVSLAAAAAQTAAIPLANQAVPPARGTPTASEWAKPEAQAFVSKAKTFAGNDPDLQFDAAWNCNASGTHVGGAGGLGPAGGGPGGDGAILQNSTSRIPFVPTSNPPVRLPPERIADNLWYFGTTAVGTLLVTSDDGYILFDTLNNADEARDILVGGMRKVGLDPAKIRYVVFGHFHLDHTGGARYIQELVRPKMMLMGREDWPLYFAAVAADGKTDEAV